VPERISPSAGLEPGKGHWLVSRSRGQAQEEARRSPRALMGKLCGGLCGKGTLGRHKSFIPFAVKRNRPSGHELKNKFHLNQLMAVATTYFFSN